MNKVLNTAMIAAVLAATPLSTQAQKPAGLPGGYPNKPIKILIGLAAGGGVDILCRAVGEKLSQEWGVPVLVDNRPGAGGVIALDMLEQSAPDGYTMASGGSQIELAAVFRRTKYDIQTSFEPVVQMTTQPYLLLVANNVKANSVKELIALARSMPGKLNYGSAGIGSAGHLGHELFNSESGIKVTHIPYKGSGAARADMAAGRLQMMFFSTISGSSMVKAGQARAIAVTSMERIPNMPDLPTVHEAGVANFEMANNYGMFVKAKTSPAIVDALNKGISKAVNHDDVNSRLAADGAQALPAHTAAQYKARFNGNIARWAGVVKETGIKP